MDRSRVGAVLTSASVHDSQVAIPLMEITSRRICYCYDLLDSAYDAEAIHGYSLHLNHVPIIAPHSRRATTKKPIELQEVFPRQTDAATEPSASRAIQTTHDERASERAAEG